MFAHAALSPVRPEREASTMNLASISQSDLDSVIAYHTALNGEPGDDPKSPENVKAFMDVYAEEDSPELAEDYAAWKASLPVESKSPVNVTDTAATLSPDKSAIHNAAVAEIVGMIRAKYTEDGLRSFAIGKRAFEHAQWQKGNFPGEYLNGDFNALMARIRDDVRMFVPIKAESIRVADWTRCHVLRERVAAEASRDIADSLSMHEYLALVGKALHFTVKDLEGDLNPGFLDMIKGVAADRAKPDGRVTTEDFLNRIAATVKRVADAKVAALDPAKAAALAASNAVKATTAAKTKAVKDITASVNDSIANGSITPEGALSILEGVAAHHGKPLVSAAIGFNPSTATLADCDALAAAMFAAGKLAEMKHLMAKLAKGVATMEKAAKKAAAPAPVAEPVGELVGAGV